MQDAGSTTAGETAGAAPVGRRWVVLGLCTSLMMCSQFYRVSTAVIAADLQRDLGLSSEGLGRLSAAFFYAFALMQVPLAVALDRVGGRRAMTVLSLIGSAGAVVFATSEQPAGATLGRVLLGIGMAGNLMGSMKIVGHWFSAREFATVSGVVVGAGTLGNMLATTPLALLVEAAGWRRSFLLISVVSTAITLLFWALVRESPEARRTPAAAGAPLRTGQMLARLLGSRDYWIISFGMFCRYGAFLAVQGLWAVPYLVEVGGLSALEASSLVLLLNVAFAIGAPLGGWLSDRVLRSRKGIVIVGLAGIVASEVALAVGGRASSAWAFAAMLVVMGAATSFGSTGYAHIKQLMPDEMSGMAMTGVNCFNMLGAAAFVHAMGWVLDRWAVAGGQRGAEGYRAAFLLSAAVVALAVALYTLTRGPRVASR